MTGMCWIEDINIHLSKLRAAGRAPIFPSLTLSRILVTVGQLFWRGGKKEEEEGEVVVDDIMKGTPNYDTSLKWLKLLFYTKALPYLPGKILF